MKSAQDLGGREFDWLAVDAEGAVALLSTVGGGYAPAPVVESTDDYNAAIDAILALPVRTRAHCDRELRPDLMNIWKLVAERGLFAFDSDPFGGAYRVIAAPEEPIRASDLPAAVAEVVRRIVYADLRFGDVTELTEAQLGG